MTINVTEALRNWHRSEAIPPPYHCNPCPSQPSKRPQGTSQPLWHCAGNRDGGEPRPSSLVLGSSLVPQSHLPVLRKAIQHCHHLWLAPAWSQNAARADTEDRNCPSELLKTKHLKAKDENPFSGTPLLDPRLNSQLETCCKLFWDPGGMTCLAMRPLLTATSTSTPAKAQGSPGALGTLPSHRSCLGEPRILLPNRITKAGRSAAIPGQHCDLLQRFRHRHCVCQTNTKYPSCTQQSILPGHTAPHHAQGGRSRVMKGASVRVGPNTSCVQFPEGLSKLSPPRWH